MTKIVFIEDESALQKSVSEVLSKEGYTIFSALDGEQGVEIVRREKPDLVLLDLILPKKDGFKVLQEIKSDESVKNIPVIILTNLEGASDIERVLELGATNYFVKADHTLEQLLFKIKKALDEK